jgi:WD40 repeat protein
MEEEMMKIMGFGGFGKAKKVEKQQVKVIDSVKLVEPSKMNISQEHEVEKEHLKSDFQIVNMELPDEASTEEDSDSDESIDLIDKLPFAASCTLKDHDKAVTAMSLDQAHSRLITASRDNFVKLWDFSTMRGNFKPFKTVEPVEGSPLRDIQWGVKGDCFLVIPANWQPMLFDRDGNEVCSFDKGDPYLRDLKNVKGHTAALTCGRWHPTDSNVFLTASFDSTIKVWDINNRR